METGTPDIGNPAIQRRKSRLRFWLLLAVRIIVAALILYAVVQTVSPSEVVRAFDSARVEYIVAAALLAIANLGLQILKWSYFVRLADPSSSNLETIASLLFGITLGIITPGQLGEFGGRALRHRSLSPATIVGLTLVDKLQMLLVMGIAGIVSYVTLLSITMWLQLLIIAVVWVTFLYTFFRPGLLKAVFLMVRLKIFRQRWAEDFLSSLSLFQASALRFALFISFAFYGVVYLQMYLLLNAFSPVSLWDAFLGFAAMMFLKAVLPISFGDLGIREASSVYFYSLVGIPQAAALNASLLLFVVNIVIPAMLGLLFIPKFPSSRGGSSSEENRTLEKRE